MGAQHSQPSAVDVVKSLDVPSGAVVRAECCQLWCRFAVVPLTEETGIIEWVPNTHGLRHCCQDIYIADGTYDKRTVNANIKKIYDTFQVGAMLCFEMVQAGSAVVLMCKAGQVCALSEITLHDIVNAECLSGS